MEKKIILVKTGKAFENIIARYKDFEHWIVRGLGVAPDRIWVVDICENERLPGADQCLGVVISGSHAMVTENLDWSLSLEAWLRDVTKAGIPVLGICYGHQVLARAMGGQVDFHPKGIEIGCVDIRLTGRPDPLFQGLPNTFKVHACHSQTVVRLPDQAVKIAENDFEPHHAFRMGDSVWGVQFHPEYDPAIMKAYVENMTDAVQASGQDVQQVTQCLEETPEALKILERFGRFCILRGKEKG